MPFAFVHGVRTRVAGVVRRIITGDPSGAPAWVTGIAAGDDTGYFTPESAVWRVHADLATLVGGVRALLMQTLHPAAVTGVDQHSTYRADALGRLAGTTRWLTVTTFGSTAQADREAARVRGLHRRVVGEFTDATGVRRAYRADDDRFLTWVHVAFTESFLATHLAFGGPLPPGAPDDYVRGWARAAEMVGVSDPPRSVAELRACMDSFAPELVRTPEMERTLAFLRRPPLPWPSLIGYRVLFAGAVTTLRPEHRALLGLTGRPGPLGVVERAAARAAVRALLAGLRVALSAGSPSIAAARARHARLSAAAPGARRPGGRPDRCSRPG